MNKEELFQLSILLNILLVCFISIGANIVELITLLLFGVIFAFFCSLFEFCFKSLKEFVEKKIRKHK